MTDVSVGAAIASGFHLIRRRPVSVVIWGLIQSATYAAIFASVAPTYVDMLSRFTGAGTGVAPSAMIGQIFQTEGLIMLAGFGGLIVHVIVICAVMRAVLRPEPDRFAYLRLGVTEAMFLFALLVFYVLITVGEFVVLIPTMILGGVLFASGSHGAMFAVVAAAMAIIFAAASYVLLRLAMAWPMIVDTGKFRLFESWAVTKGRLGPLFLTGLGAFAILIVIEFVGLVIGAAVFAGWAAGRHVTSPGEMAAALTGLAPILPLAGIVATPVFGAIVAIFYAPWANLYRQFGGAMVEAPFT